MFPPQDSVERFISLRRLTLGDNIFDIINIRSIERDRPPGHVVTKYLTRLENQIRRAIDRADAEAESCPSSKNLRPSMVFNNGESGSSLVAV